MVNESGDDKPSPPLPANGAKPPTDKLLIRRRGLSIPATLDIMPVVACPRTAKEGDYTSLRDVMAWPPTPGALSPATTPGAGGSSEIRIKNRLVQQAAQAYLQPTPTARVNRRRGLLPFSLGELLSRCFQFLGRVFGSVCGSLSPLGWHNVYIIHIKY